MDLNWAQGETSGTAVCLLLIQFPCPLGPPLFLVNCDFGYHVTGSVDIPIVWSLPLTVGPGPS